MDFGDVTGGRPSRRAVLLAAVAAPFALVGCDGADQTTGTTAEPDPELAKQHDAMREFYKTNPLPRAKK